MARCVHVFVFCFKVIRSYKKLKFVWNKYINYACFLRLHLYSLFYLRKKLRFQKYPLWPVENPNEIFKDHLTLLRCWYWFTIVCWKLLLNSHFIQLLADVISSISLFSEYLDLKQKLENINSVSAEQWNMDNSVNPPLREHMPCFNLSGLFLTLWPIYIWEYISGEAYGQRRSLSCPIKWYTQWDRPLY